MGFDSFKSILAAENNEQNTFATFRKTPSQATSANVWFDLSMSPGMPLPNYYASSPLVANTLLGADGLNYGGNVSPGIRHLKGLSLFIDSAIGVPCIFLLCDYLLYYPFIDMGTTDPQTLTNTITLPRYTDGVGVKAILVQLFPQIGSQSFSYTYTNSNGISGRVSPTISFNTSTSTGALITTNTAAVNTAGPFLPLQLGDVGIRSIDTFTMNSSDIGSVALVLVKPLAQIVLLEQTAVVEISYIKDFFSMPRIYDGAYLNFIGMSSGSLASRSCHGTISTIWSV